MSVFILVLPGAEEVPMAVADGPTPQKAASSLHCKSSMDSQG